MPLDIFKSPEEVESAVNRGNSQQASAFGLNFANSLGSRTSSRNRMLAQIGASFGYGFGQGAFGEDKNAIAIAKKRKDLIEGADFNDRGSLVSAAQELTSMGDQESAKMFLKRAEDIKEESTGIDPNKLSGKSQLIHMASHPEYWGQEMSDSAKKELFGNSEAVTQLEKLQNRRGQLEELLKADPSNQAIKKNLDETNSLIDKTTTIIGRTEYDNLTAGQQDRLLGQRQDIRRARSDLSEMINVLENDPSKAGLVGSLRRGAQLAAGIGVDLASLFGESGSVFAKGLISDAQKKIQEDKLNGNLFNIFDPSIPEIKQFEIALAYHIARTSKPDGRFNSDDVKNAFKQANITGITSSFDAVSRLKAIQRRMQQQDDDLTDRIGDKNYLKDKAREPTVVKKYKSKKDNGRVVIERSDGSKVYEDTGEEYK